MTANIEVEKREKYLIMHLEGDFNAADDNDALLAKFRELSEKAQVRVVVDIRKVVYLNSGSIGVLLSGNALMKKKDGKISLFGASDYLANIFNITKLHLAFDICETEEEAVEAILK